MLVAYGDIISTSGVYVRVKSGSKICYHIEQICSEDGILTNLDCAPIFAIFLMIM
jgi:hypothetical protein